MPRDNRIVYVAPRFQTRRKSQSVYIHLYIICEFNKNRWTIFFFTKICIQSTLIKPSSRLVYNPTNVILKVSSRACIREYTCVSNPSLRSFYLFLFCIGVSGKSGASSGYVDAMVEAMQFSPPPPRDLRSCCCCPTDNQGIHSDLFRAIEC